MQNSGINNDLGGFADYMDIAENTTVEKFFTQQLAGRQAEDYLIRVNRQPVARDYVLQEGDRVTATPTKVEGAVPELIIKNLGASVLD